jgi:hypothetical protein
LRSDYEALVGQARVDERVLGLVLTGSRATEVFARPWSDWDVRLIARDDVAYPVTHSDAVEVAVLSLGDFEASGEAGSPDEWDRYSYVHAVVVLDKLAGRISELVARKATLSEAEAEEIGARALDAYVNGYYRSAKNLALGLADESHLDAAESVSPFLTALFAMHGRVRPFNKYLRWELENHRLEGTSWDADVLSSLLRRIVESGDLETQQQLFRGTETLARRRGFGSVIDGWEPDVAWLRGGR